MAPDPRRLALNTLLSTMAPHVYFQPKPNIAMEYPCIVYNRDDIRTEFAEDGPYRNTKRYQVTVIDADPDSEIVDLLKRLPLCVFAQHFVTENLNHDVFSLYF